MLQEPINLPKIIGREIHFDKTDPMDAKKNRLQDFHKVSTDNMTKKLSAYLEKPKDVNEQGYDKPTKSHVHPENIKISLHSLNSPHCLH